MYYRFSNSGFQNRPIISLSKFLRRMYEGSEVGGKCLLLCPRDLKQTGSLGSYWSQALPLWLLDVDLLVQVPGSHRPKTKLHALAVDR